MKTISSWFAARVAADIQRTPDASNHIHSLSSVLRVGLWLVLVLQLNSAQVNADSSGLGPGHDIRSQLPGSGFVGNIDRAPIAVDSMVTGRPTDVVVDLRVPQDPNFDGIALAAGESIVVQLPDAFVFDDEGGLFPVCALADPACPNACTPNTLECTTVVFLQGWPQSPIPPTVELLPDNRLKLTAVADTGPRIKQVHLITKGFKNPRPGTYTFAFTRLDSNGVVHGRGAAQIEVLRRVGPSINVFSVPADGNPLPPHANTIYQRALTGGSPAFDWFFLVWGRGGEPMTDLSLEHVRENHYRLLQGHRPVGKVTIHAPDGASGQGLEIIADLGTTPTPVIGTGPGGAAAPLVQQYRMRFTGGDAAGGYETEFHLFRGNTLRMFVEVESP